MRSALSILLLLAGTLTARAAVDCAALEHSIQPFEATVSRTYATKKATASSWSKTLVEQVYRSPDGFDFVITSGANDLSKLRYWNGLPLELHSRRLKADYRTAMRYELDRDKSYASGHDFAQVFTTEFSNPKLPGVTAKGLGSLRLRHVNDVHDLAVGACDVPVEHYKGVSTTSLLGQDLGEETMDVLYSPDLRQALLVRMEGSDGIVEERTTGLSTTFSQIPHPGY